MVVRLLSLTILSFVFFLSKFFVLIDSNVIFLVELSIFAIKLLVTSARLFVQTYVKE